MPALGVTAGARIPHGDPYINQVLLLLHGNGANNGAVFPDHSQYQRTVTRIDANVFTSTAQSKFNGSSIYGSGTGSGFLTLTINQFAGRNWCFEQFVRRDAAFDWFGLWYLSSNLLTRIAGLGDDGSYKLFFFVNGTLTLSSLAALPALEWVHVAVTCEQGAGADNTIRLFVGGVLQQQANSTSVNLDLTGQTTLSLGRCNAPGFYGINGYFAEYRVTLATRYTQDFTPPTQPFPNAV